MVNSPLFFPEDYVVELVVLNNDEKKEVPFFSEWTPCQTT